MKIARNALAVGHECQFAAGCGQLVTACAFARQIVNERYGQGGGTAFDGADVHPHRQRGAVGARERLLGVEAVVGIVGPLAVPCGIGEGGDGGAGLRTPPRAGPRRREHLVDRPTNELAEASVGVHMPAIHEVAFDDTVVQVLENLLGAPALVEHLLLERGGGRNTMKEGNETRQRLRGQVHQSHSSVNFGRTTVADGEVEPQPRLAGFAVTQGAE